MYKWLQLTYKPPQKPTSSRVYIWRKLQQLGAVLLYDGVWFLPSNVRTLEQFQWLAAEIEELHGSVALWESSAVLPGQDESLVKQFQVQVEPQYGQILQELQQEDADVGKLSRKYQQILKKDHFQSDMGRKVREALLAVRGGSEE